MTSIFLKPLRDAVKLISNCKWMFIFTWQCEKIYDSLTLGGRVFADFFVDSFISLLPTIISAHLKSQKKWECIQEGRVNGRTAFFVAVILQLFPVCQEHSRGN